MGFLDYDVEIRKIICSANTIESRNVYHGHAVRAPRILPDRTRVLTHCTSSPACWRNSTRQGNAGSSDAFTATVTLCRRARALRRAAMVEWSGRDAGLACLCPRA